MNFIKEMLIFLLIISPLLIIFCIVMTSCTISFTNISTHGVADDVLQEDQAATARVSPNLNIPAI